MTTAAKTCDLAFHEAANIFPLMEEHELDELGKDIAENGLQLPIETYEGRIIDGRNRYRACLLHCPDKIEVHDVDDIVSDPIAYVRSLNLHRRHLNESQRGVCAAKCREMYDRQAKDRLKIRKGDQPGATVETFPQLEQGKSRDKAAADWGVSGRTVDKATAVLKEAEPEVIDAVERGKMTLNTANKVRKLPKAKQKRAAEEAKKAGNKAAVAVVKASSDDCLKNIVSCEEKLGEKYARLAIDLLRKIPKDDKLRARGLEMVKEWIAENE